MIDKKRPSFEKFLSGFDIVELYRNSEYIDEVDDINRSIQFVDNAWVIVDDYRLSAIWERRIRDRAKYIVAVDDLADRAHDCDVLIDQKWMADDRFSQRYSGLVPSNCKFFLGPNYAMLDPKYAGSPCLKSKTETQSIIFSLGGGGDLALLSGIIRSLTHSLSKQSVLFKVVIGPAAINGHLIYDLAAKDSRIRPIEGASCLVDLFHDSNLFVGAAGSSLYELNCTRVPSITFSLADNQGGDYRSLEALGHYLHLSYEEFQNIDAVARLIETSLTHLPRLESLVDSAVVRVDGKGIARITEGLIAFDADHQSDRRSPPEKITESVVDEELYVENLSASVTVSSISDQDINQYLDARNLNKNRQNMTEKSLILRVEHYIWWFDNGRHSYVLHTETNKLLYIWHQVRQFNELDYLIGGWFVCDDSCGFEIASLALKWQLKFTGEQCKGVPWLAVIAKNNRFVNLLNQYMGFNSISDHEYLSAAKYFFPSATANDFNYVEKTPNSPRPDKM